jgi:hypothetical protein
VSEAITDRQRFGSLRPPTDVALAGGRSASRDAGVSSRSRSVSGSPTATATTTLPSPAAATPSPTALTIDTFIAQANALCTSANTAGAAVPTPNTSNGSVTNPAVGDLPVIATYFSSFTPLLNALVPQLQALGTPPSNQSEWAAALAAFQTVISDFQNGLTAAQAGDLNAYETAIAQEQTDNNQVVQDFTQFGATVCAGQSSSSPTPSASPSPT